MKEVINLFVTKAYAQSVGTGDFRDLFTFNKSNTTGLNGLLGIVVALINWFLVAVGIIAFIYLVMYGIKYITSGGDAGKATEARNGIINAIIGIIVIVLAFFIIRFAVSVGLNPADQP